MTAQAERCQRRRMETPAAHQCFLWCCSPGGWDTSHEAKTYGEGRAEPSSGSLSVSAGSSPHIHSISRSIGPNRRGPPHSCRCHSSCDSCIHLFFICLRPARQLLHVRLIRRPSRRCRCRASPAGVTAARSSPCPCGNLLIPHHTQLTRRPTPCMGIFLLLLLLSLFIRAAIVRWVVEVILIL